MSVLHLFNSLYRLQASALNQLEAVKERSVSGLQAAMEGTTRRYINLTVQPSRIILPEGGHLTE